MPHNFAHVLADLRRQTGFSGSFDIAEALTLIRKISDELSISVEVIQTQTRGATYYVEDDGVRRNFVQNPSFEHDLTSWTESITATGTTARDSTQQATGKQSLKLTMTGSSGSGQVVSRSITITGRAAAEVWSVGCAINYTALSNSKVILRMEFLSSGGSVLATHNTERTTVTSGFLTLDNDNRPSPANTTQLKISLILASTASSATGIVFCDSVIGEKATTSGTYFDGDSQSCFWESSPHASENINDVDGTAAICGFFKVSA